MKILIAEALLFETGAASITALQERDIIRAVLTRVHVATSRGPRPLAANSVVTLIGAPRL